MEIILAISIGVLTGSGVLTGCCCARTFQVIMGLSLLSYAVNLFIFSMGRLGLALAKSQCCCPAWRRICSNTTPTLPQAWCSPPSSSALP